MAKKTIDGQYIDAEGNVRIDEAAAFRKVQPIPQGMSGFDNPLPPINTPNRTAKDLQTGIKQFDFATKGDVLDTSTVLAKNRGIQLRTGSGRPEDKFNQQYSPDDPNAFGYQDRFLFMKDPVNHYTEVPGFVTETDGMVYEKNFLANGPIKGFAIDPKKSVPTKDSGALTVGSDVIGSPASDSEMEKMFGDAEDLSSSQKQPTTPKDMQSIGDEDMRRISNLKNVLENRDTPLKPTFDPKIMDKDVTDPALRGPKKVF